MRLAVEQPRLFSNGFTPNGEKQIVGLLTTAQDDVTIVRLCFMASKVAL